ncbi:FMN reductase [Kaistia algarum]|uniref:NADPH-dependent FMN reductase n=1 Tax=Kaistia algarum TaxID=2083279 RepID=UPI000CE872A2|nr:NAD(P)H-dependent oxidoreductase [Kaistia algarum]MCX5515764.1 NAD(P)H-dependent oxidoreductase [Kaistia algarum]PPE80861.1 FMN reductase [Kaistia algarum]
MSKPKIAVIIGSTRPTRNADKPARWIADLAEKTGSFEVELVDLADYDLPLFNAPASDLWMPSPDPVAQKWQAKLAEFDGYIFVTPEYNHSITGALKNALDWASKPFIKKAAAFVAFGSVGGARAVEHLRMILVELQTANVRQAVHIGGGDFMAIMLGQKTWDDVLPQYERFTPELFENLLWWTEATRAQRAAEAAKAG